MFVSKQRRAKLDRQARLTPQFAEAVLGLPRMDSARKFREIGFKELNRPNAGTAELAGVINRFELLPGLGVISRLKVRPAVTMRSAQRSL